MQTLEMLSIISFNARAEASRAGEAGRGFAIIAAQVGHQVDQTSALTRNVEKHVMAAKLLLRKQQP